MNTVIVFHSALLPPSETFVKAQVEALTQWRPIIIGYRLIPDGLLLEGVDVRLAPGLPDRTFGRIKLRLSQLVGVAHAPTVHTLQTVGAKLVHAHFGTEAVELWPSVRKLGLPMLVTLHGYDINTHPQWWKSGRGGIRRCSYPRRLLRLAREPKVHFVAVSKAIRERTIEYGIPTDKITVRYIGVDTKKFFPGSVPICERPKRILFVGRLAEKKGAEYLIRAYAEIRKQAPEAELVIVGDGPLRKQLEVLTKSLNVPVAFHGMLSSDRVKEQMDHARIFCSPSVVAKNGDAEGLPIVILEAQACGLPVISSARGGATEALLHGVTGFRFEEKDQKVLVSYAVKLLQDDDLLLRFSENAVNFVNDRFRLDNCTADLEKLYQRLGFSFPGA